MQWCHHMQQMADEVAAAGLDNVRANREHWKARAVEVVPGLKHYLRSQHFAGNLPFQLDEADPVGSWLDAALAGETDESWRRQAEEKRQLLGSCERC